MTIPGPDDSMSIVHNPHPNIYKLFFHFALFMYTKT